MLKKNNLYYKLSMKNFSFQVNLVSFRIQFSPISKIVNYFEKIVCCHAQRKLFTSN